MQDWFTIIAGIMGTLVAALAVMGRLERGKRMRAEKRAEVFEHQANVARETARVLHEVAIDRDDKLRAVEHDAEMQRKRAQAANKELMSAADSREKVAGLWNKTFGKEDEDG